MDDLIIRALRGQVTVEEAERVRYWRSESDANEEYYSRLRRLWLLLDVAAPVGASPDASKIRETVDRASGHMDDLASSPHAVPIRARNSRERAAGRPGWSSRRSRIASLMAASIAAVGIFLVLRATLVPLTPERITISEIVTGAGEMVTVKLADGSTIRVGPQTTLSVFQEGNERVAWLNGRAFFAVEKDLSRTFTVRTDLGEATALGTRFEVRSEDREFHVLVVEGSVRVNAAGASVEVGEGLVSQSIGGGPPATSRIEDLNLTMEWMGPVLVFNGTPLRRAISEIENQYDLPILLEDSTLVDVTVTATFTDRPVDEVVLVVCAAVEATCLIEDTQIRIGVTQVN